MWHLPYIGMGLVRPIKPSGEKSLRWQSLIRAVDVIIQRIQKPLGIAHATFGQIGVEPCQISGGDGGKRIQFRVRFAIA